MVVVQSKDNVFVISYFCFDSLFVLLEIIEDVGLVIVVVQNLLYLIDGEFHVAKVLRSSQNKVSAKGSVKRKKRKK